ncbi:hypothetical protein [Methylobacterium sp. CCH5-D2]|uniref:hypothetical protein n=1 Tax=Methylobacterium sp. CCH5-D2 TaxID=1768765 RepID=UPI00082B49B0|nr:hypothetical protein [Methylobacterium sp. CCH5-D2]
MQHYLPGRVCSVDDLKAGDCALVRVESGTVRLAFVVDLGGELGLLDPLGTHEGTARPVVYKLSSFNNEDCLALGQARIVPNVTPDWLRYGQWTELPATTLYVANDTMVIRAMNGHRVATFDLVTGRLARAATESMFHTPVWRVEVPRADGKYETLAEFGG